MRGFLAEVSACRIRRVSAIEPAPEALKLALMGPCPSVGFALSETRIERIVGFVPGKVNRNMKSAERRLHIRVPAGERHDPSTTGRGTQFQRARIEE